MINTDFDSDIEYLHEMVESNEELYSVLSELDVSRASVIVVEAIKLLLKQEGEVKEAIKEAEVQLVHFCFKNWLVLALCKKLLQVMKPEALVIHHSLKAHFKKIYLKSQCHFSLPALINQTLNGLSR